MASGPETQPPAPVTVDPDRTVPPELKFSDPRVKDDFWKIKASRQSFSGTDGIVTQDGVCVASHPTVPLKTASPSPCTQLKCR